MGTDEKGRLNLSRRDTLPKIEGEDRRPPRPRTNNNDKFRENPNNRRPYNREERREEPKAEIKEPPAPVVEPAKVEEPAAEAESKGLFGFFKKK